MTQREWERALADKLTWLDESQRREILAALAQQEIARAHAVLLAERERQPKNITVQRAYEAFRRLAIQDLETVIGGLQLVPRKVAGSPSLSSTGHVRTIFERVDGRTPFESVIRGSGIDRLRALELLADLLRHGLIRVEASVSPRSLPPRDDRATIPDPEEVAIQTALMRRMPTPAASPAALSSLARVPSGRAIPAVPDLELPAPELAPPSGDLVPSAPPPPPEPPGPAPLEAPAAVTPPSEPEPHAEPKPVPAPPQATKPPQPPEARAPMADAASPSLQKVVASPPVVSDPLGQVSPPRPAGGRRSRSLLPLVVAAVVTSAIAVVAVIVATRDRPESPPEDMTESSAMPPPPPPTSPGSAAASAAPPASTAGGVSKPIQLTLDVQPKFARVYLDGVLLTTSARVQSLPRDGRKYVVRVESPGYVPRETTFEANADVRLVISLNRIPPRR
ncbi:MAG: hypothetical protein JNL21_23025 [Myxococcales bacterium]|nr:hypothetical protein [Myxococcales bacterium]